ncbi:LIM domain-containing protein WLIM2b-like [Iris pallida]|uniref:LIM domain-containing protein WLIM2b-like n=1 Tax=Iris pallida TaxID=29817 RepID=A0AAX6H748_IRIPA|nr:LIM domain-containing protein WLIM2b-like [Iris pallida]
MEEKMSIKPTLFQVFEEIRTQFYTSLIQVCIFYTRVQRSICLIYVISSYKQGPGHARNLSSLDMEGKIQQQNGSKWSTMTS